MDADRIGNGERGIFEDPGEIDPNLWEELSSRDPDEVCSRAAISFDRERACYLVPFLNLMYGCSPSRRFIERLTGEDPDGLSFQFYLVLLTYLLRAQALGLSGRMVTGSEIPGGDFFFKGPHVLFTAPLEKRFGRAPGAFLEAGLRLGGSATEFGDASFRIWPLPRIPLGYILWAADDEFPERLVVTFDASIEKHLPLDVIWALVNEVGRMLLKSA